MNETPEPSVSVPRSGYDIPVYGLSNGSFYYIHIPAIICISCSFLSAVLCVVLSVRRRIYRSFFRRWSKSERFVIYLALCDGSFNVSHFLDHTHIVIAKSHVYPKELCTFYGFNLAVFVTAQFLMVNICAINLFMLMFLDKDLKFGRNDWKLFLWTFGAPLLGSATAVISGQLGPNGVFCIFDAVNGKIANICFTTIPLALIILINTILYSLTFKRLHDHSKAINRSLSGASTSLGASQRAAQNMSLFVMAFFIQWLAMAVYGIWGLVDEIVPQALFHLVTTFSNIGGCLNLFVLLLIRRKKPVRANKMSTVENTRLCSDRGRFSRTAATLPTSVGVSRSEVYTTR